MPLVLTAAALVALLVIAVIDLRTLRAPNRYVLAALALALGAALASRSGATLADAALGVLLAFVLLLVVALIGRGAMGFGDVKYGAACGALVGVGGVLPMLMVTFVGGALFAVVMLGSRLRSRRDVVAFTPFLLVGVVVTLAWPGLAAGTL